MGVGPAYAIPKALQKAKLTTRDIDIFEINEAFASQCLYSVESLGIDVNKVNPKGGAIALGHPLVSDIRHKVRVERARHCVCVCVCVHFLSFSNPIGLHRRSSNCHSPARVEAPREEVWCHQHVHRYRHGGRRRH